MRTLCITVLILISVPVLSQERVTFTVKKPTPAVASDKIRTPDNFSRTSTGNWRPNTYNDHQLTAQISLDAYSGHHFRKAIDPLFISATGVVDLNDAVSIHTGMHVGRLERPGTYRGALVGLVIRYIRHPWWSARINPMTEFRYSVGIANNLSPEEGGRNEYGQYDFGLGVAVSHVFTRHLDLHFKYSYSLDLPHASGLFYPNVSACFNIHRTVQRRRSQGIIFL